MPADQPHPTCAPPSVIDDAIADARNGRPAMKSDGRILVAEIDALRSIVRASLAMGYLPTLTDAAQDGAIVRAIAAGPATREPAIEALSAYTDAELKSELARRDSVAYEARWAEMKAKAKYLCPDFGGPDSWHERDCPSDTDCT